MRKTHISVFAACFAALATASGPVCAAESQFESAQIWVVYSASDKDAQVFIAMGAKEPMAEVFVASPDGRVVAQAHFDDAGKIGQADMRFESPEPSLGDLQAAYPPGTYKFSGKTVAGGTLRGEAQLSYEFPDAPVIAAPGHDSSVTATAAVELRWSSIPNAEKIHIEVEDDPASGLFSIDLPGNATSVRLPDGFLRSSKTYVFDVKAIGKSGNYTVTDVTFKAE